MRRKKMNLGSLRRLVKETIEETKSNTIKYNRAKSQKNRDVILESIIADTIKVLTLVEGIEGDNLSDADASNTNQRHPYQDFVQKVINGKLPMENNKTAIEEFLKMDVPGQEGKKMYQITLNGDGSEGDKFTWAMASQGPCSNLKPSQNQVFLPQSISGYLTRIQKYPPSVEQILGQTYSDSGIFTSEDGYIIDGHHRCSAISGLNPSLNMTTMTMNKPIKACLQILNFILGAVTKDKTGNPGQDAYRASGESGDIWTNAPTPDSVKEVLTKIFETGKDTKGHSCRKDFMPDGSDVNSGWIKFLNVCINSGLDVAIPEGDGAREADPESGTKARQGHAGQSAWEGGEINAQNVEEMKTKFCTLVAHNYSKWDEPKGMPARTEMPQLEEPKSGGTGVGAEHKFFPNDLENQMKAGEYELDGSRTVAESIDLRRWNKLAGLLKD